MTNIHIFWACASLVVATLAMPFEAQAMSVSQFESESHDQQDTDVSLAIFKIVDDVATVNPAISKAIHDYFEVTPPGKPEATGLIKFFVQLQVLDNLAKQQGKLQLLDNIQIETVLLDLVKRDVMPQFAKSAPPSPPVDDPIGQGGFIRPPQK